MMNYIPVPKEFTTEMEFKTYSSLLYNYEVTRYPSGIEVTDVEPGQERLGIGVVVDTWNLKFGSIPVGGSSSRYIELVNLGQRDAKVLFRAYGNISSYVGFSENNFILHPQDNVTVKIIFRPGDNPGTVGNYTGEIDKIVKMPKYDFLYMFW
jgi:hypothetical protein